MFAIIAAVIFALALLLDLADAHVGDALTPMTLLTAGLFCIALHLAGVGARVGVGTGRAWARRRR